MSKSQTPSRLLVLDIDGLRRDVFRACLNNGSLENLEIVLGTDSAGAVHLDAVSPAPSVTFTCQTTIFTGKQPDEHGIAGNQFFDRFGSRSGGTPRFYAFDVGDTLAVDDAVLVFTGKQGLLSRVLDPSIPTLYEIAAAKGKTSTVVYHMLARGSNTWIKPNLLDIARFTKGGGLVGMSAEEYDGKMLSLAIDHIREGNHPDILTLYFMGLDHHSHFHGPASQADYLQRVVDVQLAELFKELKFHDLYQDTLLVVVSDHGQKAVIADDEHSLRIGFPFDREMGYLFDALGLDVHDFPGEDPNCDAVVASNGGIAHVYLQHRQKHWKDVPRFEEDVLRVAAALWEANHSGTYAPDLKNALSTILVRNTEEEGWEADYMVYKPQGLTAIPEYLSTHSEIQAAAGEERIRHLAGPHSGDILLLSNYEEGYYFGSPIPGIHGGIHPDDSNAVLSFAWIGADREQQHSLEDAIAAVSENNKSRGYTSLADMLPTLRRVFDW